MQDISILFKSGREVRIKADLDKLFEIMDQAMKSANETKSAVYSITLGTTYLTPSANR